MQFKVPQFLDIEDKIFGPFTFRQFVYLAGGAGICFVLYRVFGFFFGVIPILIIAGLVLALAFYKPNNKPFIFTLEAAIKYFIQKKLYVWKKEKKTKAKNLGARELPESAVINSILPEAKLTGSKLKDLAWSLDVLDINKNESLENK